MQTWSCASGNRTTFPENLSTNFRGQASNFQDPKGRKGVRTLALLMSAVVSAAAIVSCERATPNSAGTLTAAAAAEPLHDQPHGQREVRLTGTVEAIHSSKI